MTWGVVATVKEPVNLLAAFASHYANLGAEQIFLYLDGADAAAESCLQRVPGCVITVADENYFQSVWGAARPSSPRRRQRLNATHAYKRAEVDWLLHIDADEFLQVQNFGDELASYGDEVDTVKIQNGERIFISGKPSDKMFDGVMLTPKQMRRWQKQKFFSPEVLKLSDAGFLAHRWGKNATRVGRGYKIGVHAPQRTKPFHQVTSEHTVFCHYDGMTDLHWMLKLLRYKDVGLNLKRTRQSRFRYEQIQRVLHAESGVDAVTDLHNLLRVYDGSRVEELQDSGFVSSIPLNPEVSLKSVFLEEEFDLSAKAFNDHLATQMPKQYAQLAM